MIRKTAPGAGHKTRAATQRGSNGQKRDDELAIGEPVLIAGSSLIAAAIGSQVRDLRSKLNLTGTELAAQAGLSGGMLSKIENGTVLASIESLDALARVFNIPLASLLARYNERRHCTYVPRGSGFAVERRGTPAGHHYEMLGHSISSETVVELFLVTLTGSVQSPPLFSHPGTEFVHVLRGRLVYQHAGKTYSLSPGDTLFFDSAGLHGPSDLLEAPAVYLSWRYRAHNAVLP